MMVKNEERNLRRCLDSVRQLADELIVVDTGSTDATVAIAKEYGASVLHSPWRNDFSFHRNESMAPATGDWVLIIDADEQLVIEDGHDIRAQLAAIGSECDATRMWVEDLQGGVVTMRHQTNRIFRRGRVRYEGIKHNFPVFGGEVVAQLAGVKILHYGYDKDQIEGKAERDLELLKKMREQNPDDAKILYYLAQTYGFYLNEWSRALALCAQYIDMAKNDENFQASAYVSGATMARNAGDPEAVTRLISEGLDRYPDDIDLHYLATRQAATDGRGDEAEHHAKAYLNAFDRLQNEPHLHDSRFVFFANPDSLCFVLQASALCALFRGLSALSAFREWLPRASASGRESLRDCMNQDLARIGELFGLELEV